MDIYQLQDGLRRSGAKISPLATTVLTREISDVKLSLNVSPCSWMYQGYGLQVQVQMAGGGSVYLQNKAVAFEKATEEDLNRLFDKVTLTTCKRCGKPAFDPAANDTNRAGLCEHCFLSDLQKEFDKASAKEAKRMARLDAKHRKNGFTHRVDAWIHPAHGDDLQISFYCKGAPSKQLISNEIRKAGSCKLDDYTVVDLNSPSPSM